MDILKTLAEEFKIKEEQVKETVALIDEGNTIPFISRYRKEVTGGLDDATLRDLNDRLNYLRKMDERRDEISNLIDAQGKLTPEITFALNNAKTLVEPKQAENVGVGSVIPRSVPANLAVKPERK